LNSCVYLWSAATSRVDKLCENENSGGEITGLEWTNKVSCLQPGVVWIELTFQGSTIALGTNRGTVEIWDAEYCRKIRTMSGHTGRVGTLAWNAHILSSGSRDRSILHRDTRAPEQYIRKLSGHHKQEVCGLKWNTETNQLASGGNDNKVFIWGGTDSRPTWKFGEHRAAVKAIAWSPHQRGILASGGGTADKKIRIWNSLTGGLVSEWDTGSQVRFPRIALLPKLINMMLIYRRCATYYGPRTPTRLYRHMAIVPALSKTKSTYGNIHP
jgi:cell division cycle 20-like protein 1 (cofactor of APC complex)